MRNLRFLAAFALLCAFVYAIGPVNAGVANPPNIPLPTNPVGWCSATALQPGTVRTTQIGDCPAPPADVCPAGRQTVAQVCYRYGPADCINTDVTRFESLWGRTSASDVTLDPFPGNQVFSIIRNMQKAQYLALKFTAPAGPLNLYGQMNTTETTSGPPTSYAISTRCGDFAPVDHRCRLANVLPGQPATAWKLPGYAGPALCPLTPGQTYYLNIKIANPAATHFDCSGSACKVGITSNHTP